MGHRELQRVVVRMLYDPAFVDAVQENIDRVLEGIPLRVEEKEWLLASDPRAFGVDIFRGDRGLKSLLDEYPRSGCLLFRHDKTLRGLATFFAGPEFHCAVQERDFLAPAFGAFLKRYARGRGEALEALVNLERAMAVLRRQSWGALEEGAQYRLAHNIFLHKGPHGLLELFRELGLRLAREARDLVEALLRPTLDLANLPALLTDKRELILMVAPPDKGSGISLERCPDALYPVLSLARGGCSKEALLAELRRQGADSGEDEEVLQELCDDGLLLAETAAEG